MTFYSPIENARRIREGLQSLIAGKAANFAESTAALIVVFDGEAEIYAAGRIHLFQQYLLDHVGVIPEVVKQVPACVKVFFDVGNDTTSRAEIDRLLRTEEFQLVCQELRVSQVQFGQNMYYPAHRAP